MADSCFAARFGDWMDFTPAEHAALAGLEARSRPLRRGAVLMRENDPQTDLYVLTRGTVMSYVLLDDGSRQIMRFLFPGDLMGMSALLYRRSTETVAAVTDCTVSPFDRAELTRLVTAHPRLAALLLVNDQLERIALTDRLAGLGRTSARARVAALLLEIRYSIAAAGDHPPGASFPLGLTQEEIGDATGLTAVHVNRMLRRLEQDGLIQRENGRVTLLDEGTLARIGNYTNRFAGIELNWLPPAR